MVENHSTDFQAYLQSLCIDDTYRDWQNLYTPTDALDPKRVEAKKSRSRLNLSLMLQTIQPMQQQQAPEKVERLSVLEGLRKYAANHVLIVGRPGSGKSTARLTTVVGRSRESENRSTSKNPGFSATATI